MLSKEELEAKYLKIYLRALKLRPEELKELKKIVEVETGNPDIYPAIYPNKFKKKYDEIYDKRDWASSYPFHKDNVIAFINFARQSGGFSIC